MPPREQIELKPECILKVIKIVMNQHLFTIIRKDINIYFVSNANLIPDRLLINRTLIYHVLSLLIERSVERTHRGEI